MNDSAKEKVAYLHGLMEGMKFDMTTDVGKVLKVMVEALDDLVDENDALKERMADLVDYVDDIDEDLSYLKDALLGEEDEDEDEDLDDEDVYDEDKDDEDLEEEDDEDDSEDGIGEFVCPSCGTYVYLNAEALEREMANGAVICPECHKPMKLC